jgi:ribosomal protein L20A (L18A)
MSKNAYKVEGDFQMGRQRQHFAVEVVGKDESQAREYVMTDLGSRHGVERRQVTITSVTKLADADIESAVTRRRMKE